MQQLEPKFLKATELAWNGIIKEISKGRSSFQPFYEAFTNAMEAIEIRARHDSNFEGEINMKIHSSETTVKVEKPDKVSH
jgi:hypothetical protein